MTHRPKTAAQMRAMRSLREQRRAAITAMTADGGGGAHCAHTRVPTLERVRRKTRAMEKSGGGLMEEGCGGRLWRENGVTDE
eukprot:gene1187-20367_t